MILAICEARNPNALLALAGGVTMLGLLAAVVLLIRAARDDSVLAFGTFAGTLVLGAVIAITPGGLSDNNADYLARFFAGLAAGAGCAVVVAMFRRRRPLLLGALGLLGGGAFLGTGALLFVTYLAATGECFD